MNTTDWMMNKPDEKFSNNPIMSYDIYVVVFKDNRNKTHNVEVSKNI